MVTPEEKAEMRTLKISIYALFLNYADKLITYLCYSFVPGRDRNPLIRVLQERFGLATALGISCLLGSVGILVVYFSGRGLPRPVSLALLSLIILGLWICMLVNYQVLRVMV